jgi:hypothetical protein
MLIVGFSSQAEKSKPKTPVHVHIVSMRMGVFYFKVDKEFLGADLEIYSQDGKKLFTQKVQRRKVLIDFYYEAPAKFIIRVKKGDLFEEFQFIKDTPCLEAERPSELITVLQGV